MEELFMELFDISSAQLSQTPQHAHLYAQSSGAHFQPECLDRSLCSDLQFLQTIYIGVFGYPKCHLIPHDKFNLS